MHLIHICKVREMPHPFRSMAHLTFSVVSDTLMDTCKRKNCEKDHVTLLQRAMIVSPNVRIMFSLKEKFLILFSI